VFTPSVRLAVSVRPLKIAEVSDPRAGEGIAQHLRCDLLIRSDASAFATGFDGEVYAPRADPEHRAVLRPRRDSETGERLDETRGDGERPLANALRRSSMLHV